MIKKIYRIVKPSDPITTYVGSTVNLKRRLWRHNNETLNCLLGWVDDTCYLEELEIRECNSKLASEKMEQEWMRRLRWGGYTILNFLDGRSFVEGYNKTMSDKHNTKRHQDYIKWQNNIAYHAKKEGLTSKEYRKKYNIQDYTGKKNLSK